MSSCKDIQYGVTRRTVWHGTLPIPKCVWAARGALRTAWVTAGYMNECAGRGSLCKIALWNVKTCSILLSSSSVVSLKCKRADIGRDVSLRLAISSSSYVRWDDGGAGNEKTSAKCEPYLIPHRLIVILQRDDARRSSPP